MIANVDPFVELNSPIVALAFNDIRTAAVAAEVVFKHISVISPAVG